MRYSRKLELERILKMRKPARKALIIVAGIVLMHIAGCQEAQTETPGTKKNRLIAAQNIELKKQVAQRDKQMEDLKARQGKQIEGLNEQHAKQLKGEQKKVEDCQRQAQGCEEQLGKKMDETVGEVLTSALEEGAKVREENEALKAQIAELKTKLNQPGEPEKKE